MSFKKLYIVCTRSNKSNLIEYIFVNQNKENNKLIYSCHENTNAN
jgi:hypothetical protein